MTKKICKLMAGFTVIAVSAAILSTHSQRDPIPRER